MGCLRTAALVVLGTALGALLGWIFGGSLLGVPEFAMDFARGIVGARSSVAAERLGDVQRYARLAGHVWGALQGALYGALVGAGLSALLAARRRRR